MVSVLYCTFEHIIYQGGYAVSIESRVLNGVNPQSIFTINNRRFEKLKSIIFKSIIYA